MHENRVLNRLKKVWPKAHWQTVSGMAQGGVFDCNSCFNSCEIWVEFKQAKKPKTPRGLIKPKVQKGQPAWQALREQAGGRTYVALLLDSELLILPGAAIIELASGITFQRLLELRLDEKTMFNAAGAQRPSI